MPQVAIFRVSEWPSLFFISCIINLHLTQKTIQISHHVLKTQKKKLL